MLRNNLLLTLSHLGDIWAVSYKVELEHTLTMSLSDRTSWDLLQKNKLMLTQKFVVALLTIAKD